MPTIDLSRIELAYGLHERPEDGMGLLEAVSWVAREPFSDQPQCVSPAIAAFGRCWNDSLSDEDRNQLLKPLIPKLIGTRTTAEDEETRAWMATDWLARVHTPAWLRLAGLEEEARALEALARIEDATTARVAQPALDRARERAVAAGEAARAAASIATGKLAWSSAWGAATDAARAAARDAGGEPAWEAAWDPYTTGAKAVRAVAGAAVRDAALDATLAAARAATADVAADAARGAWEAWVASGGGAWADAWDAAWADAADAAAEKAEDDEEVWDAAWEAARAAAGDAACAAARDAARVAHEKGRAAAAAKFRSLVEKLQESAVTLMTAMCEVGAATDPDDRPRQPLRAHGKEGEAG